MTGMVFWAVMTKRFMVPLVGVISAVCAVVGQFAPSHLLDLRSASTPQLVALLALLVLPAITVAAVLADRRMLGRRVAAAHPGDGSDMASEHSADPFHSRRETLETPAVPVAVHAAAVKPAVPVIRHPARAHGAANPGVAVRVVIEPKPMMEVITVTRRPAHVGRAA